MNRKVFHSARRKMKIRQYVVDQRLGWDRLTYRRIERGNTQPTDEQISTLVNFFSLQDRFPEAQVNSTTNEGQ